MALVFPCLASTLNLSLGFSQWFGDYGAFFLNGEVLLGIHRLAPRLGSILSILLFFVLLNGRSSLWHVLEIQGSVATAISQNDIVAAAVLSSNRIFGVVCIL